MIVIVRKDTLLHLLAIGAEPLALDPEPSPDSPNQERLLVVEPGDAPEGYHS